MLNARAPATDVSAEDDLKWVKYAESGTVQVATFEEVSGLQQYVSGRPNLPSAGFAALESFAEEQMENGPNKVDPIERVSSILVAEENDSSLEAIPMSSFYPEFAIGLLENGCTAFLVGPRHALTTADCVYNVSSGSFKSDFNFWRGRNLNTFLQKMEWSEVILPFNFYSSASSYSGGNWALISYKISSASPVWLKMGYSKNTINLSFTVTGYLGSKPYGELYSTTCDNQNVTSGQSLLNLTCASNEMFNGGPILKGYNFHRSKMPVVYGISQSNNVATSSHYVGVVFHPKLFWSLCFFMTESGYNPKCSLKLY